MRKFSIYLAECPRDKNNESYHSSLILVDETKGRQDVIQQLHYDDHRPASYTPHVRKGMRNDERLNRAIVRGLIGGDENVVLARWNHMLKQALRHKTDPVPKEPDLRGTKGHVNCRSCIAAAALSIGIDIAKEFYASTSGVQTKKVSVGEKFDEAGRDVSDLDVLWRENEALCEQLPCPWDKTSQQFTPTQRDLEAFFRD